MVLERVAPFVQYLKEQSPNTPVILVESITYEDAWLKDSRREIVQEKIESLTAEVKDRLEAEKNLKKNRRSSTMPAD